MSKPAGARQGYEIHSKPVVIEGESMMSAYCSGHWLAGARVKRSKTSSQAIPGMSGACTLAVVVAAEGGLDILRLQASRRMIGGEAGRRCRRPAGDKGDVSGLHLPH